MRASSASKRDDYVYKRRKLQRNTAALPTEEKNARDSAQRRACYHGIESSADHPLVMLHEDLDRAPSNLVGSSVTSDNGNISFSRWCHLQKSSDTGSSHVNEAGHIVSVQYAGTHNKRSVEEDDVPVESSPNCLQKHVSEHNFGTNNSCSTSRTALVLGSNFMKAKLKDNYSSPNIVMTEQPGKFSSVKELCISVLKSHGLFANTRACASLEVLHVADNNSPVLCKVCGCIDNHLKMLICDHCEEAFHRSCCKPKVKKLPVDEWYCQNCSPRKANAVLKNCTGVSHKGSEMPKHKRSISIRDPSVLSGMLGDNEHYTSGVRIGKKFQAEVPQWSGPVLDDCNCFDEPAELDPTKCASLNGWSFKTSSIGNWVQCREVIYKERVYNDERTVCGKWRRAPLFEVQTEDWDCSRALAWDSIHADCAVPQELDTESVLKQLKYVAELKSQLANNKQKADQTRSNGLNKTRSNNYNTKPVTSTEKKFVTSSEKAAAVNTKQ